MHKGDRRKLGKTHGRDENAPGFDSTHSGTVDVHKVFTVSDLPTLLELRLTDIAMQGDILILCVQ
jgi:hypothetical protein